ncbi:aminotransferase class I/II-fold pyridoxal phosphate-dependent enzyme [Deinococcus detaillensis]|uniref:Aminotransferase class I/II-fold pyridoxal phosphate-dependent enzyme n=1 Tax=Deinococcus detaillensis TaxID=2592048 RepID=A0A553V3J8_9DEIO|nr:aminotransferase class I/II-fold pyridoxal phosphate-dependent enzyme [Deinococcus detaillensis]TSA86801.1 aminotransferase class I/II-fold pyridoxal phosphate-dependent enzyme [Deinococcus detaillensis]
MPSLHARTSLSAESIFSRMSRLALQHGAINLGQGFPSNPPPTFLLEAARQAVGTVDQYSPPIGLPLLREAVAQDLKVKAEQVVITCGATEAMLALAQTLYGAGDEVIAFEPVFDIYVPQTEIVGAKFVGVPMVLGAAGWELDIDALRQAITPRTKALIINSPFNPTGSIFTRAELQAVVDLARQHDFWLISDEVYDELYYAERPISLRTLAPERTFTVGSAGKRLEATGWRIGWIITPEGLASEVAGLHQWTTFCAPAPLQAAVASALIEARENGFYDQLRASYEARMQSLAAGLRQLGAEVFTPQGTYFLTARLPNVNTEELVIGGGVAVIPMSAFYRQHPAPPYMMRFAFCKKEDEIQEALRRLKTFLEY